MIDFLIIFFKKLVYLNINLLFSIAMALLVIKIGKIKHPKVKYVIWGMIIFRFFYDILIYSPNSKIPSNLFSPETKGAGILCFGAGFEPESLKYLRTFLISMTFSKFNIYYSAGDILTYLIGLKWAVFLSFFIFSLGIYFTIKNLINYFFFKIQINKSALYLNDCENNKIYLFDQISTPITFGFLKPMILLPPSLLCLYNDNELTSVIKHEIMHIRRKDHIIFTMLLFSKSLFLFVYPLKIAIKHILKIEEQICDNESIKHENEKGFIAKALIKTLEFQLKAKEFKKDFLKVIAVPGFVENKKEVEERLKNIFFDYKISINFKTKLIHGLIYLIFFILVMSSTILK